MVSTLFLVSVGPGKQEFIAPAARQAIEESEVIVAYDYYLNWIRNWVENKVLVTMPLTQEKQRVHAAMESARTGKNTALISSGDIGIYGLAPLLFEEMEEQEPFEVKVIPGISASNASASLLGAPLAHDFITLSLSDLLCPWDWIEARARAAASADLCMALYNVQSQKRFDGIYKIIDILLANKPSSTLCGVVHNAYRDDQTTQIVTLEQLRTMKFDMFTCIIVGNRYTRKKGRFMFTPRGYNAFDAGLQSKASVEIKTNEDDFSHIPSEAVWIFSGTSDGNSLAQEIVGQGHPVVISAATEYGAETARKACPSAAVIFGSLGAQRRSALLQKKQPRLIVDATHPFAEQISKQLKVISEDLSLPYIRFQRETAADTNTTQISYCSTIDEAVETALRFGKRIFLATGSRNIEDYIKAAHTSDIEWFVRITPDAASIDKVLAAGILRQNILAMQGPFSKEMNLALWAGWQIDVVITKESGTAGGLQEKIDAASELNVPLIILKSPPASKGAVSTFTQVLQLVEKGRDR